MTVVQWWPHTEDVRVASYRLRCRQIVDSLQRMGLEAGIFRPGSPEAPQVLVLSKRYDPASVQTALALRQRAGTRLILDLCDNHLHVDNADAKLLQRAETLRHALRSVDQVVVSSQALGEVVTAECGSEVRVTVIPDACEPASEPRGVERLHDLRSEWDRRRLATQLLRSGVPLSRRLLWFGNHGSLGAEGGMNDLQRIRDALHAAHAAAPLSLSVISNDAAKFARLTDGWRLPVSYLTWNAATFSRAARLHSAVLVPVGANPFTRCKTNNRIATAFVHGLNVIADSIPSYEEFADCAVLDDWRRGLDVYLQDARRRISDIVDGQARLAERYSLASVTSLWRQAVHPAEPPGDAS